MSRRLAPPLALLLALGALLPGPAAADGRWRLDATGRVAVELLSDAAASEVRVALRDRTSLLAVDDATAALLEALGLRTGYSQVASWSGGDGPALSCPSIGVDLLCHADAAGGWALVPEPGRAVLVARGAEAPGRRTIRVVPDTASLAYDVALIAVGLALEVLVGGPVSVVAERAISLALELATEAIGAADALVHGDRTAAGRELASLAMRAWSVIVEHAPMWAAALGLSLAIDMVPPLAAIRLSIAAGKAVVALVVLAVALIDTLDGEGSMVTLAWSGGPVAEASEEPGESAGRVAFVAFDRLGLEQVYLVNGDGTGLRAVTQNDDPKTVLQRVAWSPSGKRLAVAGGTGSTDFVEVIDSFDGTASAPQRIEGALFLMWQNDDRLLTRLPRRVLFSSVAVDGSMRPQPLGREVPLAISPDGVTLLLQDPLAGDDASTLVFADARSLEEIYRVPMQHITGLVWSPDGQQVAVVDLYESVFVLPAHGGEPDLVVASCGASCQRSEYLLGWSADSERILVTGLQGDASVIWSVAAGAGPVDLSSLGPDAVGLPLRQPVGRIVATQRPGGGLAYWTAGGVTGGSAGIVARDGLSVVDLPSGVMWADWSPDGESLAYAVDEGAGYTRFSLVLASADGSDQRHVVTPGALAWGPNLEWDKSGGHLTVTPGTTPTPTAEATNHGGRAVAVSAGGYHICALLDGGTVRCWGQNQYGGLGDGTTTDSSSPVPVAGLTNVRAISAGVAHTCALLDGGTVRCWGYNAYGQLGDGTTTDSSSPVPVAGLTNVRAISAGGAHTCALLGDGTALCWGENNHGQLGGGTTTDSSSPLAVAGLTSVQAISAGGYHTCALLDDGTALCWGSDGGALGDGTTTGSSAPVRVAGLARVRAISAGGYHTCALLDDGTARCWGSNDHGQLGDGSTSNSASPLPLAGLARLRAISAGILHTCALLDDGTARCWGSNDHGQLGDGTTTDSSSPLPVAGLANVLAISAGGYYTCALVGDGSTDCRGSDH